MELAPLTRKDLPDLAKFAKAATPGLAFLDVKGWDELAFGDPDADASFVLKALEKKVWVGAAIGVAHKDASGIKNGYLKYFAVAPKLRRRGHARAIFGELERRFQKRDCAELRIGACPPPYAQGGVEMLDTASHCFLLARGYQRSGTLLDMQGDLKVWKPAFSADDLKLGKAHGLRKAGAKDAAAIELFLRQHFPHWVWEVGAALRKGTVFVTTNTSGAITGFACANGTQKAWFGPMGTAENERGKGLGRLLMWKCLEVLKKQGVKSTRIPWVGPVGFYARYAAASLGPLYWTFNKRL
jgi:mycothiol synthase